MFARVARFEGAGAEGMRAMAERMKSSDGPPEGVPSTGVTLLTDPEGNRAMVIALFETKEDLAKGDETLNGMTPPGEAAGTRASVETYEVGAEIRL